jgi:low affinity sulfate transporter 2
MEASAAVESSATVPAFEVSKRPDTGRLVLNSPSPPSLREELVGVVGKAFRPRAASDGGRPPPCAWALTALQCVFPVLQWGRSYTLKDFRSDVMAGLTLASLGIPQVGSSGACSSVLHSRRLQFQLLLRNALFVFT